MPPLRRQPIGFRSQRRDESRARTTKLDVSSSHPLTSSSTRISWRSSLADAHPPTQKRFVDVDRPRDGNGALIGRSSIAWVVTTSRLPVLRHCRSIRCPRTYRGVLVGHLPTAMGSGTYVRYRHAPSVMGVRVATPERSDGAHPDDARRAGPPETGSRAAPVGNLPTGSANPATAGRPCWIPAPRLKDSQPTHTARRHEITKFHDRKVRHRQ